MGCGNERTEDATVEGAGAPGAKRERQLSHKTVRKSKQAKVLVIGLPKVGKTTIIQTAMGKTGTA